MSSKAGGGDTKVGSRLREPPGRFHCVGESARTAQPRPRHTPTCHMANTSIQHGLHLRTSQTGQFGRMRDISFNAPAAARSGPSERIYRVQGFECDSFHVPTSNPWAILPGSLSLSHCLELRGAGKNSLFQLQVGMLRCFGRSYSRGAAGALG